MWKRRTLKGRTLSRPSSLAAFAVLMTAVATGIIPVAWAVELRGAPDPNCYLQSVAPWNRADGFVVGKGLSVCKDPGAVPFQEMRVLVERKIKGKGWVTKATGTGQATPDEATFLVKTPTKCRAGMWRSRARLWYRWAETDPWTVSYLTLVGPWRVVTRCHGAVG
jgi:hypothetical protein